LLTIINEHFGISKIESGKLELEERPLDLRACVEEEQSGLLGACCEAWPCSSFEQAPQIEWTLFELQFARFDLEKFKCR